MIVLICFFSCSNTSSISTEDYGVQLYKVEMGVITNSTYRTACSRIQNWTEITYSKIASIRNYLYDNTISDHAIETGVTINEIKEFMISHSFSNYETENEIKFIKENRNDIVFLEYRYGNDKKVWVYITE